MIYSRKGVGGLTLGGGYSWKTNQVGLTIDTIVSYDLVLPTGKQVHVTNTSYPDLFFALKVWYLSQNFTDSADTTD